MKCVEQNIELIFGKINDLLIDEGIEDPKIIEDIIQKSGESDFTFSKFISAVKDQHLDEIEELKNILLQLDLPLEGFSIGDDIKISSNKHSVLPLYTTSDVNELFHNQDHLKSKFDNWFIPLINNTVFVGDKNQSRYVSESEISKNINKLKSDIFNELVKFMKEVDPQLKDNYELFGNSVGVNYINYLIVMKAASRYFSSYVNFPQKTKSFISEKEFPVFPIESSISPVVKAYFNMLLLNNFDKFILQVTPFINIDYKYYESFNEPDNDQKYKRIFKGLDSEYHWSRKGHESESVELKEDDLTKVIVSSIPSYRKDGVTIDGMMEVKQLYLLGSRIYKFELQNYSYLKKKFGDKFKPFNQNSNEALDFYIDLISNEKIEDRSKFEKLLEIKELLLSLRNYFIEHNINEKEKNSPLSLKSIITQVINNTRGVAYSIYNSKGVLELKEMTNFDFQLTSFHSWTATAILDNTKEDYENSKNTIDTLITEDNDSDLKSLSDSSKIRVIKFFKSKFGNTLSVPVFNNMIDDLIKSKENTSVEISKVGHFKTILENLISTVEKHYDSINSSIGSSKKIIGDEEVTEVLKDIVKDPLYIAFRNAWLENYVVKPQMNINTLSGEAIPTFKLVSLANKDLELYEVYHLTKDKDDFFRSLIADPENDSESPIIGTQTKLEAISSDKQRNKSASKFTVKESFKSNFMFDFVKQLSVNSSFGVMLGNYSDKGTIILKTVSGEHTHNGKKVISDSIENIQELIRIQGGNFYQDTVLKVIKDYYSLFKNSEMFKLDLSLLKNIKRGDDVSDFIKAFDFIDVLLKHLSDNNISIYDFNTNNINITEELHYTSYSDRPLSTNRQLLSTFVIFSSKNNFKTFVDRTNNKFIKDYKNFINSEGVIQFPEHISSELKSIASKLDISLDQFKNKSQQDTIVNDKGELNPLINKWIWLNTLYRNEFLFISAKGEYLHPHKNKSKHISNIDFSEDFWNQYEHETSGRLTVMGKRNGLFVSTITTPVRNSRVGVPDKVNLAVIDDYRSELYNISGKREKGLETHNGSSYIDYSYSKMVDASFPGKGFSGTKKPFGTFITSNNMVIKKDAENVIDNWKIMMSNNEGIKLRDLKKKMLSIPINEELQNYSDYLDNNDFYFFSEGRLKKIQYFSIYYNPSYARNVFKIRLLDVESNKITQVEESFSTLFELWENFGGEFSTDSEGNFNDGSNDLLTKVITSVQDKNNKYVLKDKIVHIVSNLSAIKSGATSVNPKSFWTNNENRNLNYQTFESRFIGPQLDANHEAEDSKIKEITQVISSLAQNRDTIHYADQAYRDIAEIIKRNSKKYSIYINEKINPSGKTLSEKDNMYLFLAKKLIRDIQSTKGDTVAKILTRSLNLVDTMPFSNINFFSSFVKSIISDLNENFISRKYPGLGAVILPSHNIIKVYDSPVFNENGEVVDYIQLTEEDIVKKAFKEKNLWGPNKEIIENYKTFYLPSVAITYDKIEIGDVIRIQDEKETSQLAIETVNKLPNIKQKLIDHYSELKLTPELALKAAYHTFDRFLEWNYREELPLEINLSNFDLFLAEDAIGRDNPFNFEFTTYSINTPQEYYELKESLKNHKSIVKVTSVPRDLKPTLFKWKVKGVTYNSFDLDSVRLRIQNELGTLSEKDAIFLEMLQKRFPHLTLEKILTKWTQRNLQLLENNKVLKSLSELRSKFKNEVDADLQIINSLFYEDDLLKDFNNVSKNYYKFSNDVYDYSVTAAELIVGDVYKNVFDRSNNETMYEIKEKGYRYFEEKISKIYDQTKDWETGMSKFKLIHQSGEEVFVNYSHNGIVDDVDTIEIESRIDEDNPDNIVYFIRGSDGKELFYFNDNRNVKVKLQDGVINIYFKTFNKDGHLLPKTERRLKEFIHRNKNKIAYFIPSTKNLKTTFKKVKFNPETESTMTVNIDIEDITNSLEKMVSGYNYSKDSMETFYKKLFHSWEKSHEFISSRIPSQSMQSFMYMKNVGYFKTLSNDAYVSVWQIWFQGSDFDIDKSYLLGSGFSGQGLFKTTETFNYDSKSKLDIIESFPSPLNKAVTIDTKGVDLTKEHSIFEELIKKYDLTEEVKNSDVILPEDILILFKNTLDKLQNSVDENLNEIKIVINSQNINESFIKFLNDHNTQKITSDYSKNNIVAKIKLILKSPSNQVLASSPVDDSLSEWKREAESVGERVNYILSPYNPLSMFKQQFEASVGKGDVGISANGLKVFFALSNYYNTYYKNADLKKLNRSFKTFSKKIKINSKTYEFGSISDTSISDKHKSKLIEILNMSPEAFKNSDAALLLSGFTSAATDNAKELIMGKINASLELASVHIYLMILGLSAKQIVEIMTSPVVEEIVNTMSDDIFETNYKSNVTTTISNLKKQHSEDKDMVENLDNFQKLYYGAQEMTNLSRLLSVNQKTSAKIEEIHNFLTNFESIVFSRENAIYGDKLNKFKRTVATSNEIDPFEIDQKKYKESIIEMVNIIKNNSNGRFTDADDDYIISILKRASNIKVKLINSSSNVETRSVSILGGEFDYRYYIFPDNSEYRKVTKEYYDLIKDTFNIFDVIETVPHFKWMIKGLFDSHMILSLSSVKYNSSFNLLKDMVAKYGSKIKSENNPSVSYVMGNDGLRIKITDDNIKRIGLYIDNLLKVNWIASSKFTSFVFTLEDIKELMKKAELTEVDFYLNDGALSLTNVRDNMFKHTVKLDSEEDFNINLKSMYGIANFKILMEKVLLKILHKNKPDTENLLKVRPLYNANGIKGKGISPAFNATDKHIPAAAEKINQLIKVFNDIDFDTSESLKLPGKLQWRQLFYIYNLLLNNDKYGDKRLTTFLEDYMRSPNSAAADFINYSYKLDSKEIDHFDLKNFLEEIDENNSKISDSALNKAEENLAKDLLFFSYNNAGYLSYSNSSSITAYNPDFLLLYGLTESFKIRQEKSSWKELRSLLSNNNFLIQIKCN